MAFRGLLIALFGFSAVLAVGENYQTYPASNYQAQYPYQTYYTLEYPEYDCVTIYKASGSTPTYYGDEYSYKPQTYYTLASEIVCTEVKKAKEYTQPSYGNQQY